MVQHTTTAILKQLENALDHILYSLGPSSIEIGTFITVVSGR